MATGINSSLLLRWLNVQEALTHQWLMVYPNDHGKISDLIKIKKHQLTLQDLIRQQEEDAAAGKGRGGGSIKGLRAKNDKNIQDRLKSPSARRMTRK